MNKKSNPLVFPAATNLIITAAVIITGAVFRRSHPSAGHWITVSGLCWYLITNLPGALKCMADLPSLPGRHKAHLLIVGVMLALLLWSLFTTSALNYFIMIVLLAVEYLLLEEKEKGEENG